MKKLKLNEQEEKNEHDKDIEKIKNMIYKHSVDLIVVGANKLDAKRV